MQIGETINGSIITKINGTLTNADALPVAEIYIDGATASTATVTPLSVGEYLYEFVTAGTVGQDVSVRVTADINGEAFTDWDYYGQIDDAGDMSAQIAELDSIIARFETEIPDAPQITIDQPTTATQTTAWGYCFDEQGNLEAGVTVQIQCIRNRGAGVHNSDIHEIISDENGIAQGFIPRGAHLEFRARRGARNWRPSFAGTDADSIELTEIIG